RRPSTTIRPVLPCVAAQVQVLLRISTSYLLGRSHAGPSTVRELAVRVRGFAGWELGRDCRNCQTLTASPAEPGGLPLVLAPWPIPAAATLPGVSPPSKTPPVRVRHCAVLSPAPLDVFGANRFGPVAAALPISHGRGQRRREGAFIVDHSSANPKARDVACWPIATDDALTASRRFRGIADMDGFSSRNDV